MPDYRQPKEKIRVEAKKALREADTRMIIDRKLREAGWDIEDKNQVSTEEPVKDGRADYLLKDRRGRPTAVIEAKRYSLNPEAGKRNGKWYIESEKVLINWK